MRLKTVRIHAALLLLACGIAEASPITYTISYAIASDQVTGTITTDGTIGNLSAANITSWSFTETGSNPFSISSLNPGTAMFCVSTNPNSCGLTATTSALVFDFLSNQNMLVFKSSLIGDGRPDVEFIAEQAVPSGPIGYFGTGQANDSFVLYCNPCSNPIAVAAAPAGPPLEVPENSSIVLLGLALAGCYVFNARRVPRRSVASQRHLLHA